MHTAMLMASDVLLAVEDEDVKPGWLGFAVVLGLAVAVVFLMFSFRKQLRKVNFKERDEENGDDPAQ